MQVIKNIRLKFGNIMLCFIISILCFSNVSALTAEETVDFNFTFNPSLSISLSSDELVIENLMPGNYANSNTISINVQTNNRNGYTLTAEVGDSETAALANNSLVNTISNTTFTSIANNANVALASFTPNYWGYTTSQSIDSSTKYSGLLYGATTTLNQTVDPSGRAVGNYYGGTVTNFTIGASAGSDQTSGEYTNIISFNIVPNVSTDVTIESLKYLQDIAKLNLSQRNSVLTSMTKDQTYQLVDIRDNKTYTVSKLKDGNIWMTKNLDLCIGCTGTTALNSTNTDLNSDLGSAAGYSTSGSTITWTPAGNATVTGTPAEITNYAAGNPANSVTGWTNSYTAPYMATGSLHEQTGNYYNYTAAIAMNDSSSISANYTVAPNSICPAGWRLPNGLTRTGGTVNISDFNTLLNAYGIAGGNGTTSSQNVGYATGGFAKMEVAPLNFARSGYVFSTTLHSYTTVGDYWSSTTYSGTNSYILSYYSGVLYPALGGDRSTGQSVRCVARKTIDDIERKTIDDIENMQDFVALSDTDKNNVVKSMVTNTQYSLKDTRDNKTYTVAKLEDGNVWMTKNLDLCIGCSGTAALNSTNTDLNSDLGSAAGYFTSAGVITWIPAGNATVTGTPAEITNFAAGNPANSVTGWTNSFTAPYMATGSLHEQTGNYYNYTAAIAMDDSSSISAKYTVAPNSICPAGWRLPNGLTKTGDTVNISDFNTLLNAYGIAGGNDTSGNENVGYATGGFAKMEVAPLNFAQSGFVDDTRLRSYTKYGYYWSSTAYSGTGSYSLGYNSGGLYPAYWSSRNIGWSVRCMLR